ncbi:MAG: polar amino acid transporter, inner rane subunit [Acidimicrobiaceae bacterium]|nr:polar amino acid transporter, inner rane subunit [Acidimicrobiaceae bacterium]
MPVRHPWRWVASAVVLVLLAMLAHSFATNSNYGFGIIGGLLFTRPVLDGVLLTLGLTGAAMGIGIVLGVVLAVMRLSPNPLVSWVSWAYIWFFRGTPVLVQLFLWYQLSYLFPHLSLGIPFGPRFVTFNTNSVIAAVTAAILALGLNEGAYMAEIVRAGILSVDAGQSEAASSLGMRRLQVMRRVVLPQAMRVIVPPTGNETISMLKTTSLASTIAVIELFGAVQQIAARTYQVIPDLLVACAWYLAITTVMTIGQFYVERHFARGAQRSLPLTPFQKLRGNLAVWRIRVAGSSR